MVFACTVIGTVYVYLGKNTVSVQSTRLSSKSYKNKNKIQLTPITSSTKTPTKTKMTRRPVHRILYQTINTS